MVAFRGYRCHGASTLPRRRLSANASASRGVAFGSNAPSARRASRSIARGRSAILQESGARAAPRPRRDPVPAARAPLRIRRRASRRRPLKSFTTNRGCPFPCSYCFNPSLVEHYGVELEEGAHPQPRERRRGDRRACGDFGPLHVIGFRESIFVYERARGCSEFGELYRKRDRRFRITATSAPT